MDHPLSFCAHVKEWKEQHSQLTRIITFLLGFYVSTIMRHWWDQLVNLPDIVDTALALNGLVVIRKLKLKLSSLTRNFECKSSQMEDSIAYLSVCCPWSGSHMGFQ